MAIFDFSKWQGTIDFGKVKSNAELLIIRVQAGSTGPDPKYKEYVAGCKANSIPFGTYAYAMYLNVADAQQEAKDCLARTDSTSQFIVVDVEEVCTKNPNDIVASTQAFIDYLHAHGVKKVGLYSGESFYNAHGLNKVKADFLWIAKYGVNDGKMHTKPSIACDLWQYSSTATESGVVGHVDIDVLNGGKPLSYFTGKTKIIPTGNGSGVLTITTEGAKLYSSKDYNSPIIRTLHAGETYKYYAIEYGWYLLGGNGYVVDKDIDVNTWTPAPAPQPEPAPVQPAPQPTPAPVEPPKPVDPTPAPVVEPPVAGQPKPETNPSVTLSDLAKNVEDEVMKNPNIQKNIIQKIFAFIKKLFS